MPRQQIYDMPFGKVYDCLIAKAERKGLSLTAYIVRLIENDPE